MKDGLDAITFDFGNTLVAFPAAPMADVVLLTAEYASVSAGWSPNEFVRVWGEERLRQFAEEVPEGREAEILRKAIQWHGPIFRANPEGCPACGRSGYKGRVGIHELMATSEGLIEAINKEAETTVLKRVAMLNGMSTLHQDSMKKVRAGLSSMAEAISNVPPDLEDLDAIREEFVIEAEVKAQEEAARKAKIEGFKQARLKGIKDKADAETAAAPAAVSDGSSPE